MTQPTPIVTLGEIYESGSTRIGRGRYPAKYTRRQVFIDGRRVGDALVWSHKRGAYDIEVDAVGRVQTVYAHKVSAIPDAIRRGIENKRFFLTIEAFWEHHRAERVRERDIAQKRAESARDDIEKIDAILAELKNPPAGVDK